jgi:Mrp family chromosome partitioning ATPase/capsular polysaccharide biosynthesis protein
VSPGNRPTAEEPNVLQSIVRHRLLILVCAVVSGLVAIAVHSARPATYGADAGLLLQQPQAAFGSGMSSGSLRDESRYVADQVTLIKSPVVLNRAQDLIRAHGSALSTQQITQSMSVTADAASNFVTIHFQAHSPDLARNGANSIADAYRSTARRELDANIAAARRSLDAAIARVTEAPAQPAGANKELLKALEARRTQLDVDARVAGSGVALLETADKATRQGASLRATLGVALVLGVLFGTGLAYGRDALKLRALRRRRPLDAPALAEIPDLGRQGNASVLPALDTPGSPEASAFSLLAAIVAGARRRPSIPTDADVRGDIGGGTAPSTNPTRFRPVAFVSATLGEGATTVAANTALAAARAGGHVLLVDGDVRESGLSRLIDTHPRLGAAQTVADASAEGPSQLVPAPTTTFQRLELPFAAGSVTLVRPGPDILAALEELRHVGGMSDLDAALEELRRACGMSDLDGSIDDFDLVYLDIPPLLESPWASQLLQFAEGVVFVVSDRAEIAAFERALADVESREIAIHGYVRNFTAADAADVSPRALAALVRPLRSRAESLVGYGRRVRPRMPQARNAESEEAPVPVPADITGIGITHQPAARPRLAIPHVFKAGRGAKGGQVSLPDERKALAERYTIDAEEAAARKEHEAEEQGRGAPAQVLPAGEAR